MELKQKLINQINKSPKLLKQYIITLELGQDSHQLMADVLIHEENKMLRKKIIQLKGKLK